MTFVATWLVTTVATLVACTLIPGLTIVGGSWAGPILFSLVLAAVNTGIKPVVKLLSLPINVLTLGINAFMLELSSFISRNLLHAGVAIDSLGTAILGSIVISIVSSIVISLTGLKKENLS